MDKTEIDILVVDDQLGVRSLLTTVLGDIGYKVVTASNGDEGVLLAKELRPKLIIMDIKMPVKDGITALYEIKDQFPDIMVVMMTAYGEVETIEQIKKGGAVGFLLKPFDIESFIKYVNNLIRGKQEKAYA
ncbi:MAG: two-component system, response regulator, stage 0 sporulation protein [Clostridia bacterium]|jgi:two-component system response regulator (stage 0 sporulation protein F)|nr:two-component system, response regulator, stage 0 sporulation protein [Clostridia bacterium]